MPQILIQYILVVLLVLCLAYLIYYLKEKGAIKDNDYFGITYTILGELDSEEASPETVKRILRAVSGAVQYIEVHFKDEENAKKEALALDKAKEALNALNLRSRVRNESIRCLIRLACAILPEKQKDGV
jgi:hypothetical protein